MNIRTGDHVKVIAGAFRGKSGKVTQVLPREGRVVVDGVNERKKNIRTRGRQQKGEIIAFFAPLNTSNVQLVCPRCGKATRIGRMTQGEKHLRQCRKCKEPIES